MENKNTEVDEAIKFFEAELRRQKDKKNESENINRNDEEQENFLEAMNKSVGKTKKVSAKPKRKITLKHAIIALLIAAGLLGAALVGGYISDKVKIAEEIEIGKKEAIVWLVENGLNINDNSLEDYAKLDFGDLSQKDAQFNLYCLSKIFSEDEFNEILKSLGFDGIGSFAHHYGYNATEYGRTYGSGRVWENYNEKYALDRANGNIEISEKASNVRGGK